MKDIMVVHNKYQDISGFDYHGFTLVEAPSNLTDDEVRRLVEDSGGDKYINLL